MAEPARNINDDELNPANRPTARSRADQAWGMNQGEAPEVDSGDSASVDSSARDRANQAWGMSPEDLADAESSGASQAGTSADTAEQNQVNPDDGGWDTNVDKGPKKRKFWTRRKKVSAGVAGVVIGGGFGLFTIMSGPLQFIHAAQLLQQFHFSAQEDFFEDRASKMYRYFRYPGADRREMRRLGVVGNRMANKIEVQFQKAGMEPEFVNGRLVAVNFDVETARAAGVDIDRITQEFGSTSSGDGRIRVEIEGKIRTSFKEKALFRSTRKSLGLTGLRANIHGNMYARRLGITRHPITRADRRVVDTVTNLRDAVRTRWKERKTSIIQDGDFQVTAHTATGQDGEDVDSRNATNADIADQLDDIADVDPEIGGTDRIRAVNTRLRGAIGVGGGVTAVTGIACTLRGLSEGADQMDALAVIIPSQRIAGYMLALGGQVQSNQDIDAMQLGFEDEQLYDESDDDNPETRPNSFFEAESIKRNLGQPGGIKTPATAKLGGSTNLLSGIVSTLGLDSAFVGATCRAASSFIGQAISITIDVVAGPVSFAAGLAVQQALNPYMDDLVRFIAREDISSDIAGAALGSVSDQGGHFLANQQFLTMAGVALTDDETAQLNERSEEIRLAFEEKSATSRYLSLNNPRSLTASMVQGYSGINQVANGLFSVPISAFTKTASLLSGRIYAQTAEPYDYGVPKYAFTPDELDTLNSNETYSNPYENSAILNEQLAARGQTIHDMHQEYSEDCFGLRFNASENFQVSEPIDMREENYPDKCRNPDLLRYRTYVADLMVQVTALCYSGDALACSELGYGADVANLGGGGLGIGSDGFVFPMRTTQNQIIENSESRWCYQSQENCHHDYNAADIFATPGTPVLAARGGRVVRASDHDNSSVGSRVTIKGDDGNLYYYAHMGEGSILVNTGQIITAGTQIGSVGVRADAVGTDPHLHFDVLPESYSTRPSCSGAGCNAFPFINPQPVLTDAFGQLP